MQAEDRVFVYSADNTLRCFDVQSRSMLWQVCFAEKFYKANFLHADANALLMWMDGKVLLQIAPDTGEYTDITPQTTSRISNPVYMDGALYCICQWEDGGTGVARLTPETGDMETYPMDIPYNYNSLKVSEDGKRFLLWCDYEDSLRLYADGQLFTMEGVAEPQLSVFSDVGETVAVVGLQEILICDMQLQPKMPIPLNGMHPVTMCFHSSNLLVAYDNDTLYRYWVSTGQALDTLNIHTRSLRDAFVWDFSQPGKLALRIDNHLNLIDTVDWALFTHVDFCLGYFPETQTALVTGFLPDGNYTMGSYRIYSAQDLIDKASSMLSGVTLTAEQKSAYGLED